MFNKIVNVDVTGLTGSSYTTLQKYSATPIFIADFDPTSEEEIIARIGDANCLLVSWRTPITQSIIEQCPNLKYIGMCCSLIDEKSANVDVCFARSKGITVKGVRDYGDEGVIEYIFSELIALAKGLRGNLWKDEAVEITGRTIGIIGMGATGQMLAKAAKAFRMEVLYYSRTRKPELEAEGICYCKLHELLEKAEIVSTHLPRNTVVLDEHAFDKFGTGKLFINTSLGLTFELEAFNKWIDKKGNFAFFDADNHNLMGNNASHPSIISTPLVTGWTKEAKERLSAKVLNNLQSYLNTNN